MVLDFGMEYVGDDTARLIEKESPPRQVGQKELPCIWLVDLLMDDVDPHAEEAKPGVGEFTAEIAMIVNGVGGNRKPEIV